MFVKLGGWWPSVKLQAVCWFFQRSRGREVKLLNSRLRLFSQDSDNTIQLIEKKKVCRPASELNNEPAKYEFFIAESDPNDPVQRIFGNPHHMSATQLRPHHLAKCAERNRLLLQILCPPVNQIKPRAR